MQHFARRAALPTLATLVLLGGTGAAWHGWRWLHTAPRFRVAELVVEGHARVTRDEIVRRAGVAPGTNLFTLSTRAVERAILAHPGIADAQVSRNLPNTLVVKVTEREPAAIVLLGEAYLADATGQLFVRASFNAADSHLPVITGLARGDCAARQSGCAERLRSALSLMRRVAARPDRPVIGELHLDAWQGATLYTRAGGTALRLGLVDSGGTDATLARFDTVWAALSVEERAATRTIHLDGVARPDRVTIALADAR